MTKSELFIHAHRMTRLTVRPGDAYQVTFGQCLRILQTAQQPVRKTDEQPTNASYDAEDVCILFILFTMLLAVPAMLLSVHIDAATATVTATTALAAAAMAIGTFFTAARSL
jgi:cell division protein FtsW (lipid II flippase)